MGYNEIKKNSTGSRDEDKRYPCVSFTDKLDTIEAETILPELPESDINPDDNNWLFNSNRNYFEQLQKYKEAQKRR